MNLGFVAPKSSRNLFLNFGDSTSSGAFYPLNSGFAKKKKTDLLLGASLCGEYRLHFMSGNPDATKVR